MVRVRSFSIWQSLCGSTFWTTTLGSSFALDFRPDSIKSENFLCWGNAQINMGEGHPLLGSLAIMIVSQQIRPPKKTPRTGIEKEAKYFFLFLRSHLQGSQTGLLCFSFGYWACLKTSGCQLSFPSLSFAFAFRWWLQRSFSETHHRLHALWIAYRFCVEYIKKKNLEGIMLAKKIQLAQRANNFAGETTNWHRNEGGLLDSMNHLSWISFMAFLLLFIFS